MRNVYHKEIVDILLSCGEDGMKVSCIAKRIYNLHADLFKPEVTFVSIDKSIGGYLWRMSKKRQSIFKKNRRGIYSVKPDMAIQLDFSLDMKDDSKGKNGCCCVAEPAPDGYGKSKAVQLSLFSDT